MPRRLVQQLVTAPPGYTRRDHGADVAAGVIVGLVALTLAIAFGIASGVTPQQGVFTAIVAGFLICALGVATIGSRFGALSFVLGSLPAARSHALRPASGTARSPSSPG